jgi:DNA-binding NtrC family response regulator
VDAMKRGAFDYLTKPADNDELTVVLGKAFEYHKLVRENVRLKAEVGGDLNFIGASPGVERVRDLIAQAGPSEATVLILGQSGTGKELVAEGLHRASNRASRPLIKVNCAALPDDLLESELFGYEKGAFTGAVKDKPGRFQLADGGTLFLDEIGEMPGALQAKLLRVLQEKTIEPLGSVKTIKVDTRIIAATNRNLKLEVEAGRFREDLYYRLAVLEIRIPPLCERKEDLPLLVSFLLRKLGNKNNKIIRTVTPAFLDALSGYDWPGNVRELENVLERALILSRSDALGPDLLPPQVSGAREAAIDMEPMVSHSMTSPASLEEAEKLAILRALEENGNHRERTADALGISRRTLQYKLKKFGLTRR